MTDAVHFRLHYSFGLCRSETWWDGPQPRMHLNRVSLESENISLVIFLSLLFVIAFQIRQLCDTNCNPLFSVTFCFDCEVFCVVGVTQPPGHSAPQKGRVGRSIRAMSPPPSTAVSSPAASRLTTLQDYSTLPWDVIATFP